MSTDGTRGIGALRATAPDRVDPLERILLLRTFHGFESMSVEQIATIAEHSAEVCFEPGDVILARGAPVGTVHYILDGAAEARRDGVVVASYHGRSVVGVLPALAGVADDRQVVAVTRTCALALRTSDMIDLFEDNFEMLLVMLRTVATEFIAVRRRCGERAGFAAPVASAVRLRGPLDLVDKITALRRATPLARARIEVLARLARFTRERHCLPGQILWRPGVASGSVLVVCHGTLEGISDDGSQRFRFGVGDLVGGLDSMADLERWFEVRAADEALLLEFEMDAFYDVLEDHGDMAMAALSALAAGLLELRGRLAERDRPLDSSRPD